MQKKLIFLILFSSLLMSDERFKNTNNMPNLKSFGDFLKWSFNKKRPTPIKIESSDEWKNFSDHKENYLIWIGHSTFLINIENTTYLNLVLIFFIFSFVWSFFLGFGTPVIILTAFLFDVVVGTILLSLSRSLGSLSMYILLKKFNLNNVININ